LKQSETNKEFLMVAKTFHGLEDVLSLELEAMGAKRIQKNTRAVMFYGDKALLYKANFALRTALRILKPMFTFSAKNENDLYKKVKHIKWDDYISLNDTFLIDTTISHSNFFNHTKYVSQKIKDAIVDQFRDKYGRRPSVNKYTPKIRINTHISESNITISMDSSGESLHKRGYRIQKRSAPINEVLAAGIILLSNWEKGTILKDPMCGSGTILIEAAMIAKNQAPNLNRQNFGFSFWKDFDTQLFKEIKQSLIKQEKIISQKIEGRDYHFASISASRNNISHLKLSEFIELKRFNFFDQKTKNEKRHIIFNPPYGERLEILDPEFYLKMGNIFKQFYEGSVVWMITSDFENAKLIGLKPSKKIELFNGPLECHLLKYELYDGSKKNK
jgi:putative N6-adenine-specific DNA methylase